MTNLKLLLNLGFIKELILSFVPTFFAYVGFIEQIFFTVEAVGVSILIFFILFIILVVIKIKEYQSSVSKALANGYYKNFMEKLTGLLASRGNNEITFYLHNETKTFTPQQISVEVYLANSYSELLAKDAAAKKEAQIVYIDRDAYNYPFYVWASVTNDRLMIYDTPRTLLALKDYVDPTLETEAELDKETKPFYKAFNREIKKCWTRLDKRGISIALHE